MKKYFLHSGWKLKPGTFQFIPAGIRSQLKSVPATVPGTVHTDLFTAKIIPDPFFADNENKINWIHQSDWQYWTRFDLPAALKPNLPIAIVFEGLDTITDIFLNGEFLGRTANMFRRYEFLVKSRLKSRNNILMVKFRSPTHYGQQLEKKLGKLPVALSSERVYLRKAQYSFGWDWGPVFPTMGIWRAVYLCQPPRIRINQVRFQVQKLLPEKALAMVQLEFTGNPRDCRILVDLGDGKKSYYSRSIGLQGNRSNISLTVHNPRLWWPNGEGEPFLYQLKISLTDQQGEILDQWQGEVGLRIIRLVLKEKKRSVFKFYVNGKYVFIKGVNWIPADSFLPRITEKSYRTVLTLARDAQINMIRVWGGGIYENEQFYQLCDELGLMVWQDFMFACGSYPEDKQFLENVKEEIRQNVNRLQRHPAIAIWCGNNENEWIWYQQNQQAVRSMPGFRIFHKIIPKIISQLDPSRPYWPSTPFGEDPDPNSENSGNRHQWEIWSHWKDYSEVIQDKSLFVSEFGFQGPPERRTMERYLPPSCRTVHNPLFEFHNKQVGGNERIFRFLAAHLPVISSWGDFFYLAQLNQALALKTCIEHWRLRSPETAGSIIWQLNDCWPVTSWSLIDSQTIPKLAYYLVREAFSPLLAVTSFQDSKLKLTILNDSRQLFHGKAEIIFFDSRSGKAIAELTLPVQLAGQSRINIDRIFSRHLNQSDSWICVTSLYDQNKLLRYRNCFSPRPWKHLILPSPQVQLSVDSSASPHNLLISTTRLALFLDVYHPNFNFYPRGFVLLPGEVRRIYSLKSFDKTLPIQKIKVFSLNEYLLQKTGNGDSLNILKGN